MRFYDQVIKDASIEPYVKEALDGAVIIDCSAVSTYFFEESEQEHWDMKDFPNIAPPLEYFWLDFKAPSKVVSSERGITPWKPPAPSWWGFQVYGIDLVTQEDKSIFLSSCKPEQEDYFKTIINAARWGMDMYFFWRQLDTIIGPVWQWRLLVDDQGQIIHDPVTGQATVSTGCTHPAMKEHIMLLSEEVGEDEAQQQTYFHVIPFWHAALLSISFMHCKNVGLESVTPTKQQVHNKSQKRRGVQPYQPVPYKVLNIYPMKEVLRHEGKSETTGVKKALHICRGHFRDYSKGAGLFGNPKLKGVYWTPQTVRGAKERGVSTKDYKIEL